MQQGAPTLKRVHFELGGKNPVIVFEDADLDRALDAVVFMIYSLNGERCTSSSRALVQASIYDEFVATLAERVKQHQGRPSARSGHRDRPADPSAPLRKGARRYFDKAREDGRDDRGRRRARRIGRGRRLLRRSRRCSPSATNDMRIAQEEIFGPVLTAIPFDDEAEALDIANDVDVRPRRLHLDRRCRPGATAWRTSVEAGMVWVNSENIRHLPTPFGGIKASGIGRDGGDYSFDFYMETKNIAIDTDEHKISRMGV